MLAIRWRDYELKHLKIDYLNNISLNRHEHAFDQIVILRRVKGKTAHGHHIEYLTENFEQCGVCYQLATK